MLYEVGRSVRVAVVQIPSCHQKKVVYNKAQYTFLVRKFTTKIENAALRNGSVHNSPPPFFALSPNLWLTAFHRR